MKTTCYLLALVITTMTSCKQASDGTVKKVYDMPQGRFAHVHDEGIGLEIVKDSVNMYYASETGEQADWHAYSVEPDLENPKNKGYLNIYNRRDTLRYAIITKDSLQIDLHYLEAGLIHSYRKD